VRTIVLTQPGHFDPDRYSPVPAPPRASDEVQVRVSSGRYPAGNGLTRFHGNHSPSLNISAHIWGHELALEIVAIGATHAQATISPLGDRLPVSRPYLKLWRVPNWAWSSRALSMPVRSLQVLGVHRDGGMRETDQTFPSTKSINRPCSANDELAAGRKCFSHRLSCGCARETLPPVSGAADRGSWPNRLRASRQFAHLGRVRHRDHAGCQWMLGLGLRPHRPAGH